MEHSKKVSMSQRIGMKIVVAASLVTLVMPAFADMAGRGGNSGARPGMGGSGGTRPGPGAGGGSAPAPGPVFGGGSAPGIGEHGGPGRGDDHGRGGHGGPGHGDHGRGGWGHGRGGYGHGGYNPYPRPYPVPVPVPVPAPYPRPNPYPNPYPYPAPNPYPYPGNGGYYTEYLQTFVNQTLVGNGTVSIKSALGLNNSKYGKEIYEVKFQARTLFGNGIAQLEINDQVTGQSLQVSSDLREYSFRLSNYGNRNGIEIDSLRIRVLGAFYVSTVGVVIER
ncbi:MAG: hypothetical protein U0T83_06125 [Bacteriovoracaceae bacterium]